MTKDRRCRAEGRPLRTLGKGMTAGEDGTVFAKGCYAGEQPTGSWVIFDDSGRHPIGNFAADVIR